MNDTPMPSNSRAVIERPRRNRRSVAIRAAVRETSLDVSHLVQPLFVRL